VPRSAAASLRPRCTSSSSRMDSSFTNRPRDAGFLPDGPSGGSPAAGPRSLVRAAWRRSRGDVRILRGWAPRDAPAWDLPGGNSGLPEGLPRRSARAR
jgi:hypothetical protein